MRSLRFVLGSLTLLTLLALAGCGDDGGGGEEIEPTYENVVAILDQSCTFSSCHGCEEEGQLGTCGAGKAQLNIEEALLADGDVRTALVGVPACEYHEMPRIDPGNPDNSWIWIKLNPENMDAEGNVQFTPDPAFDPAESPYSSPNCPLGVDDFGTNMPQSLGDPSPLRPNQLEAIRQWILDGAPGPSGGVDAG